jgi:hypothetical protein
MLQDFDSVISPWTAASPFGINARHGPGTEEIEAFSATGARWMRTHYALWADVEREKGRYTFAPEVDRFVEAWHDADIQILDVLSYGNPLHSGREDAMVAPATPEQIAAFGDYVHATVEHYKPWTKHWEVWNEPNSRQFWKPNPFPDSYVGVLRAAYQAAKSADPDCVVVGGALSGTALPFLERLLSLGSAQQMDALSIHPYRPRLEASCESSGYMEELHAVGSLVNTYRRDLPIWVTEMGWPTTSWEGSDHVSAQTQADYLARMMALSLAAGIERVFWSSFRDDNRFGLVREDFSPKPSYAAYRTLAQLLEGAECIGLADSPHGVWAVGFRKQQQDILVCWSPEQAIEVDLLGTGIRRWDIVGHAAREVDGPVRAALGPSPTYAAGHDLAVASR